MIFGKRKKEYIKQNILDNLTLCRLEGDLLAVEAAIRDNAPKTYETEGGRFKKFVNEIMTEIGNMARSVNVRELSVDKEKARKAVQIFRASHSEKELELSKNTDEFKKYIEKNLFKNDKDGLKRLSFALFFAIDERNHEYQCPEESLEVVSEIIFDDPKKLGRLYSCYKNNFEKISKQFPDNIDSALGIGTGIGGALAMSLIPFCVTGAVALMGYILNKKSVNDALKNMSPCETNSVLAFKLTLIEVSKELGEEKRKEMTDALLVEIGGIRSDAEYKWYVEGINIPECREKINTCELALSRLAKILGV